MPISNFFLAKIFKRPSKKPKITLNNQKPDGNFWLTDNKGAANENPNDNWFDQEDEGQLSVDVFETPDNIVIKSTIAGLKPKDVDISLDNDMLTIRGKREQEEQIAEENYFYHECYWGNFSRSIILPCEVKANQIKAILKNGVLTITLPKVKKARPIDVQVK